MANDEWPQALASCRTYTQDTQELQPGNLKKLDLLDAVLTGTKNDKLCSEILATKVLAAQPNLEHVNFGDGGLEVGYLLLLPLLVYGWGVGFLVHNTAAAYHAALSNNNSNNSNNNNSNNKPVLINSSLRVLNMAVLCCFRTTPSPCSRP